jgi:hypothetical protein
MAINIIIHANDAAMMIDHLFVGPHFFGAEPAARFGNLEKIATDTISRGDVNMMIEIDRRGNDSGSADARGAPEKFTIGGGNSGDGSFGQLNVLAHAINFSSNERRIMRRIVNSALCQIFFRSSGGVATTAPRIPPASPDLFGIDER